MNEKFRRFMETQNTKVYQTIGARKRPKRKSQPKQMSSRAARRQQAK